MPGALTSVSRFVLSRTDIPALSSNSRNCPLWLYALRHAATGLLTRPPGSAALSGRVKFHRAVVGRLSTCPRTPGRSVDRAIFRIALAQVGAPHLSAAACQPSGTQRETAGAGHGATPGHSPDSNSNLPAVLAYLVFLSLTYREGLN